MRLAVVGHVEWVEFAQVDRLPAAGEIVHAMNAWEEVGGGGAVAAVQLAKLAGECRLLTALGDDRLGRLAKQRLEELGVQVEAAWRESPQRRAFVHTDARAERTITVIGERLAPRRADRLAWEELEAADGVYITAGDSEAIRAARGAATLVATVRAGAPLADAGVAMDMLVRSAADPGERYCGGDLDPTPSFVASSEGAAGGMLTDARGREARWHAAPLPGPAVDAYGAGDSFAAGLTFGLAEGREPGDALELAARCGAACMTGRGPYEGQLETPA